jgi:hypothetical protein
MPINNVFGQGPGGFGPPPINPRPPGGGSRFDWKKYGRIMIYVLVRLALCSVALTCWYTVDESSRPL